MSFFFKNKEAKGANLIEFVVPFTGQRVLKINNSARDNCTKNEFRHPESSYSKKNYFAVSLIWNIR